MHARVWVVIPTYNEAENVEGIVRATVTELERVAPESHHILVVDDNSPDGTGAIADRLAEQHPQAWGCFGRREEDQVGVLVVHPHQGLAVGYHQHTGA